METAIKIGAEVSKASAENLAKVVERIFRSGYQTHMDQATIVKALDAMGKALSIENMTITGCNINGDKTVNV